MDFILSVLQQLQWGLGGLERGVVALGYRGCKRGEGRGGLQLRCCSPAASAPPLPPASAPTPPPAAATPPPDSLPHPRVAPPPPPPPLPTRPPSLARPPLQAPIEMHNSPPPCVT